LRFWGEQFGEVQKQQEEIDMPYGFNGKVLHVDLTNGETRIEEPSLSWYRTYMGGRNVALYYLLKEVPSEADPLGSENVLIFTASVITGAPIPGLSRFTVAAKSPLTNGFGEAQAGGYWGPELKHAGYDAIVIYGKAAEPVYLWIHNGKVEIRDAGHLWGKLIGQAMDNIRKEHNDNRIRVAGIGPAGENLVRLACVVDQARHTAGRCGMGAVMGSKNLKAVACRGTKQTEVADSEYIKSYAKSFSERVSHNAETKILREFGTSMYFDGCQSTGALPTRNFNQAVFEGAENCDHLAIAKNLDVSHHHCYACTVRCKKVIKAEQPYRIDPIYGAPEYETMAAFSSVCGCDNVYAMCKAHELCNSNGLDTVGTGMTIAWVMECFEKGLLTPEDTGGFTIKFGDYEGMLTLIEMITKREGFGDLLAEGSARAAKTIGRDAEKINMSVKGQEFPLHEPRAKMSVAYQYAVGPTGADHIQAEHDGPFDPNLTGYDGVAGSEPPYMAQAHPLGLLEPVSALSVSEGKVRQLYQLQLHFSFHDVLDLCIFTTAPVRITTFDELTKIVQAITGWNISFWEIMKAGERGVTMGRCFNVKHGMTQEDDVLPQRMFEPLVDGPEEGSFVPKEAFYEGMKLYYEVFGWDGETGIPTDGKLVELGLSWLREDMIPKRKKT